MKKISNLLKKNLEINLLKLLRQIKKYSFEDIFKTGLILKIKEETITKMSDLMLNKISIKELQIIEMVIIVKAIASILIKKGGLKNYKPKKAKVAGPKYGGSNVFEKNIRNPINRQASRGIKYS